MVACLGQSGGTQRVYRSSAHCLRTRTYSGSDSSWIASSWWSWSSAPDKSPASSSLRHAPGTCYSTTCYLRPVSRTAWTLTGTGLARSHSSCCLHSAAHLDFQLRQAWCLAEPWPKSRKDCPWCYYAKSPSISAPSLYHMHSTRTKCHFASDRTYPISQLLSKNFLSLEQYFVKSIFSSIYIHISEKINFMEFLSNNWGSKIPKFPLCVSTM